MTALRLWNRVRAIVIFLLSLGIAATTTAWVARYVPSLDAAVDVLTRMRTLASAFTGLFTLVYFFLTRLLGQIETDIMTILTREYGKS